MLVVGAALHRARAHEPDATTVRAAVIQGCEHGDLSPKDVNVALTPQEQDRTMALYDTLTAEAARREPVLAVWPESVLPAPPTDDPALAARVGGLVQKNKVWLLAGGPGRDGAGQLTNAAYLYSPTGDLVRRYDKVQLVPFGEYVPMRNHLPFLDRYNVRDFDFAAGAVHPVLQAGTVTLGPAICFESTFPMISWELTGKGAQLLAMITNDAWFGKSAAPAQHRQIAVLRAVENGRWVLRAASTGISCIIAPDGRIVTEAGLGQRAALTADVQLLTGPTWSVRLGAPFGWAMVAPLPSSGPLAVVGAGTPGEKAAEIEAQEAGLGAEPARVVLA